MLGFSATNQVLKSIVPYFVVCDRIETNAIS